MKINFWCTALCALAVGCSSPSSNNDAANSSNTNANNGKGDNAGGVTMCAAVRGNGQLIPAHFGSLARIVEHYGPFHAIAGGSSGSITSFLTESMQINPLVSDCSGENCTDEQTNARLGLLLKSFQGYIEFLGTTEEAVAIQSALPIVAQIREAGLESLLESDPEGARQALLGILQQDSLVSLVNPELVALLQNSPNPQYHVADVLAAAKSFGAFDATDPKIMVRPGILSFGGLAEQLGTVGSFYAGYGDAFPEAEMDAWLTNCAEAGFDKPWSQVRALPSGDSTCGAQFYGMLGAYRAAFEADDARHSRVDDNVGDFMPALISTSVLTGGGITAWEAAKAQYDGATDPTLEVSFTDVRFGYFGDRASLEALGNSTREDLKSTMAVSLGEASWRTALSLSPAEPGLARALPVDAEHVSAGGWSDLHPVLVLKDLGCDKVIYVTRTDPESNFAIGVATLLGMTPDDSSALYDLANPDSSFSQSLAEADAVWCTNWNDIEDLDFQGLGEDGYNAVLQSEDEFFVDGAGAYQNTKADSGLEGCSVPR